MIEEGSKENEAGIDVPSEQKRLPDDAALQQLVTTIASWLEETDEMPLRQIRYIVRKAGPEQTMALLKEVLAIEQNGGMLVGDKSRRRSIGGVFFYLAKSKGYMPWVSQSRKKKPTETNGKASSDAAQSAHPMWSWEHRIADMTDLQHEPGGATTVKMTLIGRPGRISNKGTFVLTTMQSSKIPALPKGLPVPAQVSTTYAVYIAQKQWKKVEEALRDPEDILIAEGYPMLDQETGTIAVFVSNTTTKFMQAAQREKQRADAQG